jgi:hypothetical protein
MCNAYVYHQFSFIRFCRFGIACVVPPDSWSPPFALEKGTNGQNAESVRFTIRKQTTSHLCMREPNAGKGKKAAGAASR